MACVLRPRAVFCPPKIAKAYFHWPAQAKVNRKKRWDALKREMSQLRQDYAEVAKQLSAKVCFLRIPIYSSNPFPVPHAHA